MASVPVFQGAEIEEVQVLPRGRLRVDFKPMVNTENVPEIPLFNLHLSIDAA